MTTAGHLLPAGAGRYQYYQHDTACYVTGLHTIAWQVKVKHVKHLVVMQTPFKQEVLTSTGPCIKLELPMCSFINRVQRLFFLNEAQNLSSFLIADLGVAEYPSYAVTRSRSKYA